MNTEPTREQLLAEIEQYRTERGGYNVARMERDYGLKSSAMALLFDEPVDDSDPRIALAVEINGRLYDEEKAAKEAAAQKAYDDFLAGTASLAQIRLLERSSIVVAEYNDPHSERPTGFRLRDSRDIDGNEYSDQAGLEENPGRL